MSESIEILQSGGEKYVPCPLGAWKELSWPEPKASPAHPSLRALFPPEVGSFPATPRNAKAERHSSHIELLAPAGSTESFYAAIDAGANAVYLGLDSFNARLRAKNFSPETLAALIPYAHKNHVRVYCTLNTLVKTTEMDKLVDILYQLDQCKIDGIIVADLGVIRLARQYFPALKLHASTQMTIHNTAGLVMAQKLGLNRVVLARELTLDEIKDVAKASNIELEVFVHGALCYSISGLCLASSFLGGASGNRGLCTQVCRRTFSTEKDQGSWFSPKDLSALDYIPAFIKAGIASLKIEGRMKNSRYVHTVVSVYRRAIDNPSLIPSLQEELDFDFGRDKSTFFLSGTQTSPLMDPHAPAGTGIILGTIISSNNTSCTLSTTHHLLPGDTIRIAGALDYQGHSAKIRTITQNQTTQTIVINEPIQLPVGATVYLTNRAETLHKGHSHHSSITGSTTLKEHCPDKEKILRNTAPRYSNRQQKAPKLTIAINDPGWLPILYKHHPDGILAKFDLPSMHSLTIDVIQKFKGTLSCGLPPFIAEPELAAWKKAIEHLAKKGVTRWFCPNISNIFLMPKGVMCIADSSLWAINRFAVQELRKLGFMSMTISPEDDILNIKNSSWADAYCYIYAHIPVFISRIAPTLTEQTIVTDSRDDLFFTATNNGLTWLLSKSPMCLFHKHDQLQEMGISNFIIDLSFCKPDPSFLNSLFSSYHTEERIPGSTIFNFKRLLL